MDGLPTIDQTAAHESRLVALSPDLLGAAGFDGMMKLVNPAWEAALGWTEEELCSRPYLELIHPDDRDGTLAVIEDLAGGERIDSFVCRVVRSDGEYRNILWSGQGSPDDGCFYIAGKDITERLRMEEELGRRAERLERTNLELQEFAYIASHDLAEPLRMISSYLELLQRRYEGQLDDTADQFIGFAVDGAVRMKILIEDLLAYSRVGSHELERRLVDLGEIARPILQGLERAIDDAAATVELVEPLPVVLGEATQLGQLLQNLVSNSVKFRAPDRPPHVRIVAVPEDDGVRITVADNGIGIPEKQFDRIFKMFARLHSRDEYQGTGIGLALCRRIAERHGGRIWVESLPGEGTSFHVWLPGS